MRKLALSLFLSFLTLSVSAATLKIEVQRNSFNGPIEVAVAPRIEDHPPEWLATKTIPAGKSAVTFPDIPAGMYIVLARGPQPLQRLSATANIGSEGGSVRLVIPKSNMSLRVTLAGQPLPRASVALTQDALRWDTELDTNDDGRFDGALWEPGVYNASVRQSRTTAPHVVNVTLAPGSRTIDVPDRHVTGRITGDDGKPLGGALVTLRSESAQSTLSVRATTAADGSFEFFGVREGAQSLSARAPSYLQSDAVTFELRGPSARHAADVQLTRGVRRTVRVIDTREHAIANAALLVACDGHLKSTAVTNAEGRADVASPERGSCIVYALPREGSIASTSIEGTPNIVIRVPAGSSSLRLALKTEDGVAFSGLSLLMRAAGNVVSPAVGRQLASRGFSLVTDADGSISLAHIPPGTYEFWPYRTESEGRMLYEVASYSAAPITLNVVTGENNAVVRFKARR